MNRAEILDTAKQCVCTDRQSQYGTPEDSFSTIGHLWEDYLAAKGQRVDLKPHAERDIRYLKGGTAE